MSYEDLRKMKAEYETAVREKGKELFLQELKGFFAKYPDIKAVGWTQYTPYFNDGDACVFRVGEACFCTKEITEEAASEDGASFSENLGWIGEYSRNPMPKSAFRDFEALVDDDIFEQAFGDHAYVIATPTAIYVNEYEHD